VHLHGSYHFDYFDAGKTATLLGLLNLLHHKEYLVYFDTIISKILSDDGISCRNRHLRSHITTDAPSLCTLGSESAVDVTKSPFVAFAIGLAKLKPRILVTAPSNIAIDNIIQRIMTKGFRDGNGVVYYPNILRIGAGYTNSSIQAVTLEGSVEKMFSCSDKTLRETLEKTKCGLVDKLRELFHLQTLLLNLRMAFNSFTSAPTIGEQDPASIPLPPGWELRVAFDTAEPYWVNHIKKTTQPNPPHREEDIAIKTSTMSADVWPVYSTFESLPEFTIYASRLVNLVEALETSFLACKRISLFLNRREISSSSSPHDFLNSVSSPKQIIEGSILDEAHIVLTTLNGSGHPSMEKAAPFPVLVVDEAGQCTEPSVLIPMRRGCKHCILVGDPMQLPATTFSPLSKSIKYDRSLLERLMRIGCEYHLLDVQYRMNPRILTFPNIEFYEGRVQNGDNVKIPSFQPSYIAANGLDPFMFFDLQSSYEVRCSTSKSRKNIEEAYFALELIEYLASIVPRPSEEHRPRVSIGVISPYLEQVQALQRLLAHHDTLCQDKAYLDVEVNTVDGFQGREMDFIIFSCVRSNSSSGIGFLSDIRRLNVALTRARFCLMLIGHGYTLSQHNETWSRLIEHAFRTNAMVHVTNSSGSMSQMLGARLQQGRNDDCYYPPIGMESDNNYRSRDESVADLSTSALNVLIREEIVSDSYFDAIEEGEIVD
jgi:senataxin